MADNRSWTLPRQHQLLSSHIGKFKEHQVAGTLALKFWPKLTAKFFKLWKNQGRELREWKMLKEMVEKGMAVPSCLGGGDSDAAKKAGLDMNLAKDGNEDDEDDGDDMESGNEATPVPKALSDLSSDEEEVRAANEAALAGKASIPAPDGASNPASKKKRQKKKKQIKINIPERLKDNKTWMATRSSRWFYNATSKSRKAAPSVNIDFKGLFSSAVGGRALTEAQMYSRMYYGSRVKEDVDAEVTEKNLNKGERIALTAKRLQEAYEGETEEIKEKVRAEIAKAAREKEEAMEILKNMVESGGEREQTHGLRVQGSLGPILRCFFDILGPLSGFAWSVVGGGPKSENLNGGMGYISYHRGWGESRNDFTFNRWYDEYQVNVVKPFGDFCHELVSAEEYRLQRAMTITDTPNLSLDALKKSGRNFGRLQSGGPIVSQVERPPTAAWHNPKLPPPNKPPTQKTTAPTKKVKSSTKAASPSQSESENSDDEESDPSDPSDHDAPRKRSKGGGAVQKTQKAKGKRKGKGKEKEKVATQDNERSDNHESNESKGRKPTPKGTKGGKAQKGDKATTKGNEGDEDKGGDDSAPRKGTKEHPTKANIVDDESGSGSEHEDQDNPEEAEQEPKKKNARKTKSGGKVKRRKAAKGKSKGKSKEAVEEDVEEEEEDEDGREESLDNGDDDGGEPVADESDLQNDASVNASTHLDHDVPPSESPSPRLPPLSPPAKRKSESAALEDGGRQKRARRQPRNVEEWVSATRAFLLTFGKSKAWEDLVEAWFNFETQGFDRPSRVTEVNSRPHELKRWLSARKGSMPGAFGPILEDVDDYRARWMDWWGDLKGASGTAGDNGRIIRKAGPSGVVTILLGLAFWTQGQARSAEWKEVVGELLGILKP